MADRVIQVADGYWNIRGSFRILGVIDVGTQSSLVRLASGGFVLLDSYSLTGDVLRQVQSLTQDGSKLEAIINLHPFHTIHVKAVSSLFPSAKLYGTARHHGKLSELPWQPELVESSEFADLWREDFEWMIPSGVDFISKNERLHFASVLAFSKSSAVLHVDDTLNWVPLPFCGRLDFHPSLGGVLERRAGAAADFRKWADELATRCESIRHVCTAHTRLAPVSEDPPGRIAERVREALARVDKVLAKHEHRFS